MFNWLKDLLRGDDGNPSHTKLANLSALYVLLASVLIAIVYDRSEGIVIGLAGISATLAGANFAVARLSADSVQKKNIEATTNQSNDDIKAKDVSMSVEGDVTVKGKKNAK